MMFNQFFDNQFILVTLIALISAICAQNAKNATYTVVAPAKLRPHSEYHVSVSMYDSPSQVEVDITVSGPSESGTFNSASKTVVVNSAETRILNLDIGEWSKGNYKLLVKGKGGFEFSNETSLEFEQKSLSVFIQTDKAIYKPSQLIQFRAIIVNPLLRPVVAGAIDIYIKDSKGNRIKQWNREFTSRGVISKELQLSDQPVLGDWTIFVEVLGQKFEKSFTVAEYVLPTFDVEVLLPPYATYNRSDVVATIKSIYTYGKPVKGEVTLTVQPKVRYAMLSVRPLEQYQIKTSIDGTVDIPVNIVRDLNLKSDLFEREIEFFALVEEGLTGRKYNKSSTMKIHDKEVKVELIKTSKTYKPGLKYTAFLKVAYQDDKPVDDNGPPLKLRYGYSYNDDDWNNTVMLTPVKGLIKIEVYPPRNKEVNVLGMRAEFKGQTYYLESVESAQSPSNNFIQVIMSEQTNAKVEQEISFDVNATEPLTRIVYEVMGRGDIVLARSVDVPNTNTFKFNILVTHKMAPKARIVTYYVRGDNQEIVADALNFDVEGVFKTQVTVDTNVEETKPGALVDVRVETKPNAYVGILGIDQSVLLLKSGNDITQQDVINELETYDTGKSNKKFPHWFKRRRRSLWWPGSSTTGEIFDDSGVVVLTNGLVHRQYQFPRFYLRRGGGGGWRSGTVEMLALDVALSTPATFNNHKIAAKKHDVADDVQSESAVKIRKFFPETWLWNNTNVGFESGLNVQYSKGQGKRIFYAPSTGEGVLVLSSPIKPVLAHDSIRLDDAILEDRLQPPSLKLTSPLESRIVLRKLFPETWLWQNTTAGNDGTAVITSIIPDTITSWFVSAFAMDQVTGLGIAPHNAKVTVFRPFFIKLSLPYSIIRGESVAIQAIVFNYLSKPLQAEVTMENRKDEFEFTNAANEIDSAGVEKVEQKRKVITIPANDGVSVVFLITPKKVGYIDIKMTATSQTAGDSVLSKLLVKPEGQPQYFNKALLVDLKDPNRTPNSIKKNISVVIPNNAVPGSEKISVSGIGDILGPTLNNLEDLLRIPYGCGEQNMLNFVPNIVILDYLSRANRLTPTIKAKALSNIESGYQRELTYKREDGSFSAFGNSDKSGSTWLTAFVVKSFLQAKSYIDIDQKVIDKSIEWLLNKQRPDGSFTEPGEVHHKAMQGGSSGGSGALAAYVLIAILQDKTAKRERRSEIQKTESFIWNEFTASRNPYDLSIIAHALHLAESQFRDNAFNRLMGFAKRTEDYIYWSEDKEKSDESDKQSAHFYLPNSNDVEMTSYALLTLVGRSDLESALPVLRWLISKQNSNGGFASTQDTVIGIQALGGLAQRISTTTVSLNIKYNYKADNETQSKQMRIDSSNDVVLQRIEMPISTKWVEIEASGFGAAIVQVSWQYNLAVSAEKPAFFLNPIKDKASTENYLQLSVCTHYKDGNATNMAVMEVELPSGYVADVEALPSQTRAKEIKRLDTSNGDTNVIIYFDRITRDEICFTVPAHRTHKVANNKPVPVTVYDYYDRAKTSRIFYEPTLTTYCDICSDNESDCNEKCKNHKKGSTGLLGEESSADINSANSLLTTSWSSLPIAAKFTLLNLVKHILAFTLMD